MTDLIGASPEVKSIVEQQNELPPGYDSMLSLVRDPKAREIIGKLGTAVREVLIQKITKGERDLVSQFENLMVAVNGESSRVLANKYETIELLKEMGLGFKLPAQLKTKFNPSDLSSNEQMDNVESTFRKAQSEIPGQRYVVKPYHGILGRSVEVLDSEKELADVLGKYKQLGVDCIVQEYVPFSEGGHDVRIVLYGDNERRVFATYIKQIRPEVTGDGSSTLESLIDNNDMIPKLQKLTLKKKYAHELNEVVLPGQTKKLAKIGNFTHGSKAALPTGIEQQNLHRAVAHLVNGLRSKGVLPQGAFNICLDTGIKDDVFNNPNASLDELVHNMTIIESQLPYMFPSAISTKLEKDTPDEQAGSLRLLGTWINSMIYALSQRDSMQQPDKKQNWAQITI